MFRLSNAAALVGAAVFFSTVGNLSSPAQAEILNCVEGVFKPFNGRQHLYWRNVCNAPIVIKWWTAAGTNCSDGCLTGKMEPGVWLYTSSTTKVLKGLSCPFEGYMDKTCVFEN